MIALRASPCARLNCDSTRNGHAEFLRQKLHAAGKLADFLIAVLGAPANAHQLQIIHHHQPELLARLLQPPQLRVHVHQVDAGRIVDIERRLHHLVRGRAQFLALLLVQISGAEPLAVHARRRAQHAGQQGFLRHFERKDRHRLQEARGHVPADIQRQRGLSHRRTRRENDQFARVQAAGHFIQLREAGADALDPLARIEKSVEAALIVLDDLERRLQPLFGARLAQPQQRLFRAREDLLGIVLGHQRAVHQLLRRDRDAPQQWPCRGRS